MELTPEQEKLVSQVKPGWSLNTDELPIYYSIMEHLDEYPLTDEQKQLLIKKNERVGWFGRADLIQRKLVKDNLYLIEEVVYKYIGEGKKFPIELEDVAYNVANQALMKAAIQHDTNKSGSFRTLFYSIFLYDMISEFRKHLRSLGRDVQSEEKLQKLINENKTFYDKTTDPLLRDELDKTIIELENKLSDLKLKHHPQHVKIDRKDSNGDEGDYNMHEVIPSTKDVTKEDIMKEEEKKQELIKHLREFLTSNEWNALRASYFEAKEPAEIASDLNIDLNLVNNLLSNAKYKIKKEFSSYPQYAKMFETL